MKKRKDSLDSAVVLLLFFTFLTQNVVYGQNKIEPSITASSQVATTSVGVPTVNHSTGIMSYGFSLMPQSFGGLNIALNLNYRAKGVKVNQTTTPIGIGWSLSATGAVFRTVRGLPDDVGFGRLRIPYYGSVQNTNFLKELNSGYRDGEADIFQLSYGHLSVSFFLEISPDNPNTYVAVPLEKSNVKISVASDPLLGIAGFQVVDESGNRYLFREQEVVVAYADGASSGYTNSHRSFASAWYLEEIETYTGEKAVFRYTSDIYSSFESRTKAQQLIYGQKWIEYGQHPQLLEQYQQTLNSIGDQTRRTILINNLMNLQREQDYLSQKHYNELLSGLPTVANRFDELQIGMIQDQINLYQQQLFNLGPQVSQYELQNMINQLATTPTTRDSRFIGAPLVSLTQGRQLTEIRLNDVIYRFAYTGVGGTLLDNGVVQHKKILLDNVKKIDMYGSVLEEIRLSYDLTNRTNTIRPFLKSLTLVDGTNSPDKDQIYAFDYNDELLNINNMFKDYWGFYNGSSDVGALPFLGVPEAYFPQEAARQNQFLVNSYSGGPLAALDTPMVRSFEPIEKHAIAHTLKTVHLPTGGRYSFVYEGNTVGDFDSYGHNFGSLLLGGIRIKEIQQWDGTDEVMSRKFYYDFKPKNRNFTESTGRYFKKGTVAFDLQIRYEGGTIPPDMLLSSEIIDLGVQFQDMGNENIQYTYVEEEIEGRGRQGYFYLPFAPSDSIYPYWLEGLLVAKVVYDQDGSVLTIDRNRYQADAVDIEPYLTDTAHLRHFVISNSHRYHGRLKQYKAFPFQTGLNTNISTYPDETDPRNFFNARTMVYNPNILPRSNPKIDSLIYYIKYGGSVLLRETENWEASSVGVIPEIKNNEGIYSHNWLFRTQGLSGIKASREFIYSNNMHPWPSVIVDSASNGNVSLVKSKRVIDFSNGVAGYIDSLRAHNKLDEVIEDQRWILFDGEQQWRFSGATHPTFSPYLLSEKDGHNPRNVFLPSLKYATEVTSPFISGEQGLMEDAFTIPPYTNVNYSSSNLFKPESVSHWRGGVLGIRYIGETRPNGGIGSVVQDRHRNVLEVLGADPDEVMLLGNLGGRAIRKKATHYTHIGGYEYGDQFRYLDGLRSRLRQPPFLPGLANEFPVNIVFAMDSVLTVLMEGTGTSQRMVNPLNRLADVLLPIISNQVMQGQFDAFAQSKTSYQEMLHLLNTFDEVFMLGVYGEGYNFLEGGNDIFSNENHLTFRMSLSKYLISSRRLHLNDLVQYPNYQLRFTYTDGTPVHVRPVALTLSPNGFWSELIDLSTLPNASKLKDLEIHAIPQTTFFVVPEGSPFKLKRKDALGKVVEERNSRGDLQTYGYDGQGRLIWTKDRDGNVVNHMEYNLGTN